jgi:hypothetical protein
MSKPEFKVQIAGENVAPETVDVADLVVLLSEFRKALSLTANNIDGSSPSEATLSLVGVEGGSIRFQMAVAGSLLPAVIAITDAIATRDFFPIPPGAQAVLAGLSRHVVRRHWELSFIPGPGANVRPAMIGAGNEVPDPSPGKLQGSTRLYGAVIKAGGVQPTVQIRPYGSTQLVSVQVSPNLARELAARLYEDVGVECEAAWEMGEWSAATFKAVAVLPYRAGTLADAFRELAAASSGRWEGVDAAAYVKTLRAEEDE